MTYFSPVVARFVQKAQDLVDARYDYETNHPDAGDAYSHLAAEGDFDYHNGTERLAEYCAENGIDITGLDLDRIAEDVIFWGEMVPGTAYDARKRFLVASYAVGEIEEQVDASDLGARFTPAIIDLLNRQTDAYWVAQDNGETALFYIVANDRYWDHVCELEQVRNVVEQHRNEQAA